MLLCKIVAIFQYLFSSNSTEHMSLKTVADELFCNDTVNEITQQYTVNCRNASKKKVFSRPCQ